MTKDYKKKNLEEDLTEAYWKWRSSFDQEGCDMKETSLNFIYALRDYQDHLRSVGHEFVK